MAVEACSLMSNSLEDREDCKHPLKDELFAELILAFQDWKLLDNKFFDMALKPVASSRQSPGLVPRQVFSI